MPRRTPEQLLAEFKDEFLEASRNKDRPVLERMLNEAFTLVDPNGQIVDRDELIEAIIHPRSTFADDFLRREYTTHFHVGKKAAREVAHVKMKGRLRGRLITGRYVNVVTYIREGNGWQMVGNSLHRRK